MASRGTLAWAVLAAALAAVPAAASLGGDPDAWLAALFVRGGGGGGGGALRHDHLSLAAPLIGTALGAWAGAFAVPLDWGAPWQCWPLPVAYGAVIGHGAGHLGVCSRAVWGWACPPHASARAVKQR